MVVTVDPSLRHGLNTLDRTNVVRLPEVVPGQDLGERNRRPILHKHLPALRPEPVVTAVDPVLVERIAPVMLQRIESVFGS